MPRRPGSPRLDTLLAARCFDGKAGAPAWHGKPSWYQVSAADRMIPPVTEQWFAERMEARETLRLDAGHASLASRPDDVAGLIDKAAQSLGARSGGEASTVSSPSANRYRNLTFRAAAAAQDGRCGGEEMVAMMLAVRSLDTADESRDIPHGHLDAVAVEGLEFGRARFEPGWRWSQDVGPIAGTASCQFHHNGFVAAGHLHVRMDDGTEADLGPGDVFVCEPGHDAWVVGDETTVVYDFGGDIVDYAKPTA